MKHDVHAFVVTRVKFAGIEADDRRQAIQKVLGRSLELYHLLDSRNMRWRPEDVTDIEFAEEIVRCLVEERRHTESLTSTWLAASSDETAGGKERLTRRLAELANGRVIPVWERCVNETDAELIIRAKALYHAIFVADSFASSDLPAYHATMRELDRRGYAVSNAIVFKQREEDEENIEQQDAGDGALSAA